MIREILRPNSNNLTISIPNEYINQEIEFIMFPLNKLEVAEDIKQEKQKSLRGIFNQYADSSKISMEDNAWKNSIIEKFKYD
jgi:hypothetical protein